MPSGIIVSDLIKSSMRLIGAIGTGETPTAAEAEDGLLVLNDLLENWSTETLAVWQTANTTVNLVGGQATYTIGAGGNFNLPRPITITDAYCTFNGTDFPVDVIDQQLYNRLGQKTMQQQIVERLLYVNDFPLGLITLWPVPAAAIPLTITMQDNLRGPVALADTLNGPPGWLKAIRFCLAVEFAPEFGMEVSATVRATAADAKGDYKRSNLTDVVAMYDGGLTEMGLVHFLRGE